MVKIDQLPVVEGEITPQIESALRKEQVDNSDAVFNVTKECNENESLIKEESIDISEDEENLSNVTTIKEKVSISDSRQQSAIYPAADALSQTGYFLETSLNDEDVKQSNGECLIIETETAQTNITIDAAAAPQFSTFDAKDDRSFSQ